MHRCCAKFACLTVAPAVNLEIKCLVWKQSRQGESPQRDSLTNSRNRMIKEYPCEKVRACKEFCANEACEWILSNMQNSDMGHWLTHHFYCMLCLFAEQHSAYLCVGRALSRRRILIRPAEKSAAWAARFSVTDQSSASGVAIFWLKI